MNELNQQIKTLNRLDYLFIIGGLVEVFCFVLITHNLFMMIVGVITIIPAYIALKKSKLKWNYFVGIWALTKYNPIGLAAISFIIGDSIMSLEEGILYPTIGLIIIVAIASFILGIIVIVKTSKYFKTLNKSIQG